MRQIITTLIIAIGISTVAHAQYDNTKIKIGAQAPELVFPNPDGKEMKLSKMNKGKYVLLDFWASWCGPCRGANPTLVGIYNKYKDSKFKNAKKGFTIVSVSLDRTNEAWKAAIEKDGLIWKGHMGDIGGGWKSKPASLYGIEFIPQAFLLGPDGKVIAKYSSSEAVEADLEKLVSE